MKSIDNLISIIVPVYKAERFLERCIESVIKQTYKKWELILVDDGSPDQCGNICDAYQKADNRIRVLHQRNQGVSQARNNGIECCHGQYLFFLDADDFLVPHALEKLSYLQNRYHADIVMGGHYRVEYNGNICVESTTWKASSSGEIREQILINQLPNFPWGKLFRRELWNNVNFPCGQFMEDMYVMGTLFYKAHNIYLTSEPLYYYSNENGSSIMIGADISAYIRVRYGKFLAWKEHQKVAEKYDKKWIPFCIRNAIRAGMRSYMLNMEIEALSNEERMDVINYLRQYRTFSLPLGYSLIRWLILTKRNKLLYMLSYIQKVILRKQQKRRQQKR